MSEIPITLALDVGKRLLFAFGCGYIGAALILYSKELSDAIFGELEFPRSPNPNGGIRHGIFERADASNGKVRGRLNLVPRPYFEAAMGAESASPEGEDHNDERECA